MREIYLDNAASTRTSDAAAETALRMMTQEYANPSSLHRGGFLAQQALERARGEIAAAIGADSSEIIFCSGGTEANNLAVLGAAAAHHRRGKTIITTAVEHSSVYEPVQHLESQGFTVKIIPPAPDGSADIDAIAEAVDEDAILVTCMYVNSETGAVSNIAAIAAKVKRKNPKALFHTDAVQAFGKLPVTVQGIDLMSVSGHKIHAPKGSGALFLRRGARILPIMYGGGHENGLRVGTQSTPLCCAFGTAARECAENREQFYIHVSKLAEYFRIKAERFDGICINSPINGTPYIQNISMPGYKSETVLHYLAERGVYASSGSACSKGKRSRILTAMNFPPKLIDSALRVSFSRYNTAEDVDAFFDCLADAKRDIACVR